MTAPLKQPGPDSSDGVGWYVFDHLIGAATSDPSVLSEMTSEQLAVFAINHLRQEVNSGGFAGYFRYDGGTTALEARSAAHRLLGPGWHLLVTEAVQLFGPDYPVDPTVRETALDAVEDADPGRLDRLDSALYRLEVDQPPDAALDDFIWANQAAFFV